MNTTSYIGVVVLMLSMVANNLTLALDEKEYLLEKKVTTMTPIFMVGHEGDLAWIEGFQIEGENFLKDEMSKAGSFSARAHIINPPMNIGEKCNVYYTFVNTFPGLGSFQVTGIGTSLRKSYGNNDTIFTYSGSILNGTGKFDNIDGQSSGNFVSDIFRGSGVITESIKIRTDY